MLATKEKQPNILESGFDKHLVRVDLAKRSGKVPPEFRNIFEEGIPPRTILSGELAATLEQIQKSLKSGKKDFTIDDPGYILGIDPDDGLAKFFIGSSTDYLYWDGTNLVLTGGGVLGSVGGFVITSTALTAGNLILNSSGQFISAGSGNDIAILDADHASFRLWIGNATAGSAPFRVTKAGVVVADIDGGTIDGTVIGGNSAAAGNFTSITSSALTSGRVALVGASGLITDDGDLTFSGDTLTGTKIKIGGAGGFISSDGSAGVSGTFVSADGTPKTITVKDGIITSIV